MLINVEIIHATQSKDFIGIKIDGENIRVFVPEAFRLVTNDPKSSKRDILKLIKSISLAKTIDSHKVNISDRIEIGTVWDIDSYLWIIEDYVNNGYFTQSVSIYEHNGSGKINWNRTLRKTPIVSNGNILYVDVVTSRAKATNTAITQVYKYCLDVSLQRIGWALDYLIKHECQVTMSISEMVQIVKDELGSTFDDERRLRYRRMLSILRGVNANYMTSKKHTYGINHYYYVYEKMIDSLFGNINYQQKQKYNPPTFWVIGDDSKHHKSPLQPDTIHAFENNKVKTTYIIDAKMYSYGGTSNLKDLPGSEAIQKQITYGDYVQNVVEQNSGSHVRNIFILPYNKEKSYFKTDDNLYYFGYASAEWRPKHELKDHDYIFGFFIDFMYLLNNYTDNNRPIDCIYSIVEKRLLSLKENKINEISTRVLSERI